MSWNRLLTDEQEAYVRQLLCDQVPTKTICALTGLTPERLRSLRFYRGWPHRKPHSKVDRLGLGSSLQYEWQHTPLSASEIAKKYGLTKNMVIRYVYDHGWSRRPSKQRTMEQRLSEYEQKFDAVVGTGCRTDSTTSMIGATAGN